MFQLCSSSALSHKTDPGDCDMATPRARRPDIGLDGPSLEWTGAVAAKS
jgi:hypothetical protein